MKDELRLLLANVQHGKAHEYLNFAFLLYLEKDNDYLIWMKRALSLNKYLCMSEVYKKEFVTLFQDQAVCFDYSDEFLEELQKKGKECAGGCCE